MTDYDKWQRFASAGVEAEEERVQQAIDRDEQERQRARAQAQLSSGVASAETEASKKAAADAAALRSKARVAALKAKRRGQRQPEAAPAPRQDPLARAADLAAQRAAAVSALLASRDAARAHEAAGRPEQARLEFERSLGLAGDLERVAAAAREAEEAAADPEPEPEAGHDHDHDHDGHGHGHGHHHHHHKPNDRLLPKMAVPEADDPASLAASVRRDAHEGIGRAQLSALRFPAASQSFRSVLLDDRGRAEAWRGRGEAFLRMGQPMIAQLHLDQLQSVREAPDVEELAAEAEALLELYDGVKGDRALLPGDRRAVDAPGSGRDLLARAGDFARQGAALAEEGCFLSAARKWHAALELVDRAGAQLRLGPGQERPWGAAVAALRAETQTNLAASLLARHTGFERARRLATAALEGATTRRARLLARVRRAQAAQAADDYDGAIGDLRAALELADGAQGETEQVLKMLQGAEHGKYHLGRV